MSISEGFAEHMLLARSQQQAQGQDEVFSGGALTPIGGGLTSVPSSGAIAVAVHRDEAKILQKIKVMARVAGQHWYYRWTVKNKDGSKSVVEGPSIDCAMAVARYYGNCDVDLRVQQDESHWTFYARFRDFETGFSLTRAFQQRKSQKTGLKDAERQLDIVFQIGQSKAHRGVITKALGDLTQYAFEQAQLSFVEKIGEKLEDYRRRAITRFSEMGVDIRRVEVILGKTVKEWLAPDIARVIAEIQAVNDGMASIDDTYPPLAGGEAASTDVPPEEPTATQQQPKQRASKPRAAAKQADETPPADDGAGSPPPETRSVSEADARMADAEAKAKEIKSLTELAELDGAITDWLEASADDIPDVAEVKTYWRQVVNRERGRITGRV